MASITTRRTIASLITRTLHSSSSSSSLTYRSRFALTLLDKNPTPKLFPDSFHILTRSKTSGSGYSPLNDPSPNWSNRPPKETILLDGCDYEHWLIVMEFPNEPKPTEDEMINSYVKTLTSVLGSEEEAKKKIYSVCTTTYTGFGALISEELSYKVKGLPGVLWVLPDSYLDVPNKDYGGDSFVDGKVIHRPQYRFSERPPIRNRPRPRYDRRRETMQVERRQPMQNQNWAQGQREPMQQPASINNQGPMQNQNWAQGQREPMQQPASINNQGPMQNQSWAQGQREPMQQPASINNQGPAQSGGNFPMNQGELNQRNA